MPEPFDADPLDELRAAWRSLEAPAPADDLAQADPATRRTVEWLRAAWETVEPERELAPPVPAPVPHLFVRPEVLVRLAAAVLVATLAALLWWSPERGGSEAREEDSLVVDGGAPEPVRRVPEPERVPEQPVRAHGVQFASLSSEKLEMRSGPVRLVLLTGGGHTADGAAPHATSEEER